MLWALLTGLLAPPQGSSYLPRRNRADGHAGEGMLLPGRRAGGLTWAGEHSPQAGVNPQPHLHTPWPLEASHACLHIDTGDPWQAQLPEGPGDPLPSELWTASPVVSLGPGSPGRGVAGIRGRGGHPDHSRFMDGAIQLGRWRRWA